MTNKRPTSTRRKLCFFLMMLACLLQAQSIAAQSVSVSFKDTPLKEILNAVEKQVDFTFVYNDNLVNVNKKFSVSVSNTDLKTFLTQLLKDSGYEYKIVEKQIVISPASFANSNSNQQTNQTASARQTSGPITVTGAVTDAATGEPLSFITVFVKDSKLSVTTRENGTYSIQVPSANSVLQYSCIGYEPAEVAINGRSKVDVQMKSTSTSLEAVVVTGFSTVDRRIFTGSSVKLKAEDIKTDGIIDIGRMLEGQAAGVSVQNVSGTFGTAPKIRVRGYTSISGENKPLWVVDGVVLEDLVNVSNDELSSGDPMTLLGSAVAGINANDIESFDILKDAAATALYGARAMNGVIVITTKRGKEGKPRITYNGNYNILMKPTYSQYNIMNSAEQMSVMAEMERKGFLNSNLINSSNSGIYGKMWKRIYTYDETNGQFGLENTPESRRNFLMRYAYANTDWFDLLFRNGLQQDHTLSISGGSTNSKTYASVSFYRDGGWTIGDNVNRYTMNFRNDYTVTDRLTLALSTMGSFRQQLTPGATSRMANNVSGGYERDFDINPFSYALNTSRALTAYDENGDLEYFTMSYCPFNIINELGKNTLNTTVIDTKILGELGYKITNDLKFQFTGSLRYNSAKREQEVREGFCCGRGLPRRL